MTMANQRVNGWVIGTCLDKPDMKYRLCHMFSRTTPSRSRAPCPWRIILLWNHVTWNCELRVKYVENNGPLITSVCGLF